MSGAWGGGRQAKTGQGRAGQEKAGQNRLSYPRAGQPCHDTTVRTGKDRAHRTLQDRAGKKRKERLRTHETGNTGQVRTLSTWEDKTELTGRYRTVQGILEGMEQDSTESQKWRDRKENGQTITEQD